MGNLVVVIGHAMGAGVGRILSRPVTTQAEYRNRSVQELFGADSGQGAEKARAPWRPFNPRRPDREHDRRRHRSAARPATTARTGVRRGKASANSATRSIPLALSMAATCARADPAGRSNSRSTRPRVAADKRQEQRRVAAGRRGRSICRWPRPAAPATAGTMAVRIRVARSESTPLTPSLANTAVRAANADTAPPRTSTQLALTWPHPDVRAPSPPQAAARSTMRRPSVLQRQPRSVSRCANAPRPPYRCVARVRHRRRGSVAISSLSPSGHQAYRQCPARGRPAELADAWRSNSKSSGGEAAGAGCGDPRRSRWIGLQRVDRLIRAAGDASIVSYCNERRRAAASNISTGRSSRAAAIQPLPGVRSGAGRCRHRHRRASPGRALRPRSACAVRGWRRRRTPVRAHPASTSRRWWSSMAPAEAAQFVAAGARAQFGGLRLRVQCLRQPAERFQRGAGERRAGRPAGAGDHQWRPQPRVLLQRLDVAGGRSRNTAAPRWCRTRPRARCRRSSSCTPSGNCA